MRRLLLLGVGLLIVLTVSVIAHWNIEQSKQSHQEALWKEATGGIDVEKLFTSLEEKEGIVIYRIVGKITRKNGLSKEASLEDERIAPLVEKALDELRLKGQIDPKSSAPETMFVAVTKR